MTGAEADVDEVPEAPDGLDERGREFWTLTLTRLEMEPDELLVLEEACRTLDTLDRLQRDLDEHGHVLPWGDGTRANPAGVEARQHRIVLVRLLRLLRAEPERGAAKW